MSIFNIPKTLSNKSKSKAIIEYSLLDRVKYDVSDILKKYVKEHKLIIGNIIYLIDSSSYYSDAMEIDSDIYINKQLYKLN